MNSMQDIIANVDEKCNVEILSSLQKAANMMAMQDKTNYGISDEGQSKLLRRIDIRAKKPRPGLNMFDYSTRPTPRLCSPPLQQPPMATIG